MPPASSPSSTTRSSTSSVPDDGRDRWWVIPAAVLGVLGAAGAAIFQARHRRQEAPTTATQPIAVADAPPPLAPLPGPAETTVNAASGQPT